MSYVGSWDHVELSVEDFVTFVLGELQVVVVIESDVGASHGLSLA
jgi:hypothetical protein